MKTDRINWTEEQLECRLLIGAHAHHAHASPFATINEAQQFMNWYRRTEHKTDWDERRRDMAAGILIQADKDGHPDY